MAELGTLIYEAKAGGTHLLFYNATPNLLPEISFREYLPELCRYLFGLKLVGGFRKINIVFETDNKFKEAFEKWVKGIIKAEEKPASPSRAYVDVKRTLKGANIIYVNPLSLEEDLRNRLGEQVRAKFVGDQVNKEYSKLCFMELKHTLPHEISHIYQYRKKVILKTIKRNSKRINKAFKKMIKSWEKAQTKLERRIKSFNRKSKKLSAAKKRGMRKRWFKSLLEKDLIDSTLELYMGNFGITWRALRIFLLNGLNLLSHEGFAQFYSLYSPSAINWEESCVREYYYKAYALSKELNERLDRLDKVFIGVIEDMQKIHKLKDSIFMMEQMANLGSEEFEKMRFELTRRLTQRNKDLFDSIKEIQKFTYGEGIWYDIGLHMYHMILFMNEDKEISHLADKNYWEIFQLYEEACAKKGWQPVVSLNSPNGVFSYRKHQLMMTRIRHDVRKLAA